MNPPCANKSHHPGTTPIGRRGEEEEIKGGSKPTKTSVKYNIVTTKRWEQSNRGQPRPAAHSRYWQQPQYRTDETAGPQLPLQESFQNEAEVTERKVWQEIDNSFLQGGADEEQQQLTGGWESSADSFVFGKQIH